MLITSPLVKISPGFGARVKTALKETEISFKSNDSYIPKNEELGMYKVLNVSTKSKHLESDINPDIFIIRMAWYRRNNPEWTSKMKQMTLETSKLMESGEDFNAILKNIEQKLPIINKDERYGRRSSQRFSSFVIFEDKRGEEYLEKYKDKLKGFESLRIKGSGKYKDINTAQISVDYDRAYINYIKTNNEKSNLDCAREVYNELKSIENPSLETILEKTATIRWLIAQEKPYIKGTESVTTILERAILHSYKIKNPAYKKSTSPDFEAFYRNLDEFIEVYPTLFEEKPEFIN